MIKPVSIIFFDRLFLGSLILGVLNFLFAWNDVSEKLASMPEFAAMGFGSGFIIGTFAVGMIINLIIWYFISVRASKIAKWILVVFFAIGLLSMLSNLSNPLGPQGLSLGIAIIITAIQGAAVYMLFRPDAAAWFNRTPPIDPETFR
jgi:Na+-transporting NADH:ubiquinone oxidoreductase subunit NqrB